MKRYFSKSMFFFVLGVFFSLITACSNSGNKQVINNTVVGKSIAFTYQNATGQLFSTLKGKTFVNVFKTDGMFTAVEKGNNPKIKPHSGSYTQQVSATDANMVTL